MAGFFGLFDYSKPGKGVDADAPQKRAPIRYFELLWRNLSRFFLLNVIYFLFMLPLVLAFHVFLFDPLVGSSYAIEGVEIYSAPITLIFLFMFSIPQWVLAALLILSAVVQGPLTCGLTYCLRNAVREEHYWRSDLFARARMNLRPGIQLGIMDALMFLVGYVNVKLYTDTFAELSSFMQVATMLSLVALVLYIAMRNTLYTMAVTFELTFVQMIRNAFILTVAGLPRQLLTGFIQAVILVAIMLLNGVVEMVLLPLIGFVLLGYTSQFITYPIVDKYLIQPQLKSDSDGEDGSDAGSV